MCKSNSKLNIVTHRNASRLHQWGLTNIWTWLNNKNCTGITHKWILHVDAELMYTFQSPARWEQARPGFSATAQQRSGCHSDLRIPFSFLFSSNALFMTRCFEACVSLIPSPFPYLSSCLFFYLLFYLSIFLSLSPFSLSSFLPLLHSPSFYLSVYLLIYIYLSIYP